MILWKIVGTLMLLTLQASAIVAVRRASHEQLVWMQFWRYRGDDNFPALRAQGEKLRDNPQELRRAATMNVVGCTFALDGFAAWIWLL
jgi:hypothetical protein